MTAPDYWTIFQRSMLRNEKHAAAMNEAAALFSGQQMAELQRRTMGDPTQINELIDALIDKYVATCEGNERAALFGVLSMFGNAMYQLAGAPGSGGRR